MRAALRRVKSAGPSFGAVKCHLTWDVSHLTSLLPRKGVRELPMVYYNPAVPVGAVYDRAVRN